jgi:dephospho-CoA kinase
VSGFVVGLTGGIASGKSALAREFVALGATVADADIAAREAVAVGTPGLEEIVADFGAQVLDASGALDRAAMRRRVFGDEEARRRLEAIVHPRVRTLLRAQCEAAPGPYAIAAIPLLAEGGGREAYPWLDRILVVDVPVATQHARLLQRDGIDPALAERMLAAQVTRADRLAIADDVVVNTGTLAGLQSHASALDRMYRALAAAASDAGMP